MPPPPKGPKRKPVEASRPALAPGGWKRPSHLKGDAAQGWDHIYSLLRATGNLARTDPTLVECYAVNFELLRSAQAVIRRDGITTTNSADKLVSHPALAILNSATMRLKALVNDFGLCPSSSRHAASVAPITPEKDSDEAEWDEILGFTG